MLNLVLDTNVLISAIVFGGKPREILEFIIEGRLRLSISEYILDKMKSVLSRKKFGFSLSVIHHIIHEILAIAEYVEPRKTVSLIKNDVADNNILACALEAQANFIITGDQHLLELELFEDTRIRTPAGFLNDFSDK